MAYNQGNNAYSGDQYPQYHGVNPTMSHQPQQAPPYQQHPTSTIPASDYHPPFPPQHVSPPQSQSYLPPVHSAPITDSHLVPGQIRPNPYANPPPHSAPGAGVHFPEAYPQQQSPYDRPIPRYGSPAGPRPRYGSYTSQAGPPVTSSMPSGPEMYMPDHRLTSPPPMLPHSYSSSSNVEAYPPTTYNYPPYGAGTGGAHTPAEDLADEPLLQRMPSQDPLRYGDPFHPPTDFGSGDPGDARNGMPGDWQAGGHDPDQPVNPHYGPAPDRMIRRLKTTKRVPLFHGNLVLECPVPSALLELCPLAHRQEQEFSVMRYTAVTCDPNDFQAENYTLRQKQLYEPTRRTEIFIVITMYNEDEELFARTMRGVIANINHLTNERDRSPTWKEEGWKKVVVCIVVDGRKVFNARTRAMLAALGVYQDGVAKNVVNGKPVTAHVYEYTTQLHINSRHQVVPGGTGKKWVPVQMILCVKEKNAKKINSHRWFFNAFSAVLNPTVCVLLDVGTEPAPTSIYHLWKAFDLKPKCGGACGEIVALKGKLWSNLLNPLVAAQNFEYKMSNILDKPLESAFGYITVLPGAFSAYRYKALENDVSGNGPLKQYFLGETMHGSDAGIFDANMYLAEDRILCWELVSKRNSDWTLHYVKSARAVTDVPDRVPELISQRRRWLNGSFFAAIHSTVHFGYIYRSSHSFTRKFFLHIELLYQLFNLIFSWFALGNYFIAFVVLTQSMQTIKSYWKYVNLPLQYLYLGLLILCFLLSMGNRPAGAKVGYTVSMVGFAIITVYMIFAAVYLAVTNIQAIEADGTISVGEVVNNKIFRNIILSLAATYGLYIVASLLAFDPWHMITSFLQYLLIAPSYINVLNVYAFSNVHDVSWGTKGSDKVSMDLGTAQPGKGAKQGEVIVEIPTEENDINKLYETELRLLAEKPVKEKQVRSKEQKQEDYYKNFRTNVLLAWVLSNGALAAVILTTGTAGSSLASTYMGILLYSVAGLAAFRFLGSTVYLIVRLFVRE